jgi:hypothetical protein
LLCEIAENENRKDFTPSERVAYGIELEQIQKLKAKENQGKRNDLTSESIDPYVKKTQKTDTIVGEKVGMSGPSYRRAKRVIESGNKEVIEKMDKGEIGIATAYDQIKKPKEDNSATPKSGKLETKEEGGQETKICKMCKRETPIERMSKTYCKDCQKELTYARRDGNTCNIEDFKVDGNAIVSELKDTKKPSEEGNQNNIDNPIVTEFELIVNSFCNSINPYIYMNGSLKGLLSLDKSKMLKLILKSEEWLTKIKNLLEVEEQ